MDDINYKVNQNVFLLYSKQILDLYEIFKTSFNVNSQCIVKTDKMSIEYATRNDIILPRSESHHDQFQNQRWPSDNRQMQTTQQNTQYVYIKTQI